MNKKIFLFSLCVCLSSLFTTVHAQVDSLRSKNHFELSFGQTILFTSQSKVVAVRNQSAIIIPTSAILLSVEFRSEKKVKIPVFINLPTESKQFLVNGQLINERASTTYGAGLEFRIVNVKLNSKTNISLEAGPLAGLIYSAKNEIYIAPILAGRIRIKRGEDFVMYIGGSYSLGINSIGLFYGTGTVF